MNRRAAASNRTGSTGASTSSSSPTAKRPPVGSTCSASHTLAWARVSSNRTGSSIRNAPLARGALEPGHASPQSRSRPFFHTNRCSEHDGPHSRHRASGQRAAPAARAADHDTGVVSAVDDHGPGLVGRRHLAGAGGRQHRDPRVAHVEVGHHLGHRLAPPAPSRACGTARSPAARGRCAAWPPGARRRRRTRRRWPPRCSPGACSGRSPTGRAPRRPRRPARAAGGSSTPSSMRPRAGARRAARPATGRSPSASSSASAPATTSADSSPRLWPTTPTTPSPPAAPPGRGPAGGARSPAGRRTGGAR